MIRRLALTSLAAAALAALAFPALAHPHVWVTAKAELVYDGEGRITGIRHAWTFDKAYSAFVTQGLDKNGDGKLTPDELQDLAKENTEALSEFDYFTVLKGNGRKQEFGAPRDYRMEYADEAVTMSYLLPLRAPAPAKTVSFEVYDPTYFVSFSLAEGDAVTLAGAPQGCATNISRPKNTEPPPQAQPMSEAFFQTLTAASTFGGQFANKAIVACP
ncbi:DUF1007 family protein [Microvirga puerhi]|uniref:DUF1007 family protein n=1 Tax=Microvirga puerhi TaxID=2876078 RepID=A0ABS7VPB9_9HYPH|nr:DUF1007 family protein [Microvirga puerhi]MBZ6077398.1 DUF1007 family protein [Microvirga puerhi]